jgi:predicted dehydrogenase
MLTSEHQATRAELALTRPVAVPTAGKPINVGVIGYGYWGPKLVRSFQEVATTRVTMVADLEAARLSHLRRTYPDIQVTCDYQTLLDSNVDAVAVATPVSTHFRVGRDCLLHDKHILVEKPLARHREEGQALIELAQQRGLVLMAGHTFEYNPAVEMLRNMVVSGELGRVYYVHSTRTNLGLFQNDINVIWDLAPHDISILLYVLGMEPVNVSASGASCLQSGIHDVAWLTLEYANGVQARVHVSWLDPCKVRRMTVVGDRKMVVFDDVEMQEKIKIYDVGVEKLEYTDNYEQFHMSYRYGDIHIPRIPLDEPLKVECTHFADCILHHERPRSDGVVGLKVVKILESAEESLQHGGARVPIRW